MNVTVRGALRFQHKPALDRGIAAFEGRCYPEFFTSALFRVDGLQAFCDETFEIEVDCLYEEAFLAMGREAVEGAVDLRASDMPHTFTRVFKFGRPINRWVKMELDDRFTPEKFGAPRERFPAEWASAAAKKPAAKKPAAKKPAPKKTTRTSAKKPAP